MTSAESVERRVTGKPSLIPGLISVIRTAIVGADQARRQAQDPGLEAERTVKGLVTTKGTVDVPAQAQEEVTPLPLAEAVTVADIVVEILTEETLQGVKTRSSADALATEPDRLVTPRYKLIAARPDAAARANVTRPTIIN